MNLEQEISETVPCQHCGTPTAMLFTKQCDSCWQTRTSGEFEKLEEANALLRSIVQKLARTHQCETDQWLSDYKPLVLEARELLSKLKEDQKKARHYLDELIEKARVKASVRKSGE